MSKRDRGGSRLGAFIHDLTTEITYALCTELGMDRERAHGLAQQIAQSACAHHRGEYIYVPTGYALQISERDQKLYRFFLDTGRNVLATARYFATTEKTVYERVRLIERGAFLKAQGNLFPGDTGG